MIPRLYKKTETAFTSYGICPLLDAMSCVVTESRNAEFELDMTYAREGRFVNEITADRIILADPYDGADKPEPFCIVSIEYDMEENLEIHAVHKSYQLNSIIIGKTSRSGNNPQNILSTMATSDRKSASCPFTFYSDIVASSNRTITTDAAMPLRSIIGGMEGSVLDKFGGELKWERNKVSLLSARGADRGVRIAYAKNLTGLKYEIDMSDVVTGVVAYYSNDNDYIESDVMDRQHTYGFNHDIVIDASSEFKKSSTIPNKVAIDMWANRELLKQPSEPKISVDVDFVLLNQISDDYAYLEHVNLCDTVEIIYPPLNLKMSAKVVKTVYNVLEDKYDGVTISNEKLKITDTIYSMMKKR